MTGRWAERVRDIDRAIAGLRWGRIHPDGDRVAISRPKEQRWGGDTRAASLGETKFEWLVARIIAPSPGLGSFHCKAIKR